MLKYTFESIKNVNVENEFQISVVKGNIGAEISRTEIEEQPNFDKIQYLDDYKINKSLTNYLFMGGKVSVRYEFNESDNISQRDVDKIVELNRKNPEDTHSTEIVTDNSYGFDIDYGGYVKAWRERSADYELSTNKASMKAIEDKMKLRPKHAVANIGSFLLALSHFEAPINIQEPKTIKLNSGNNKIA